jgi:anti-anti-sigma regulatory factor
MPDEPRAQLEAFRTATGHGVRVIGRGTLRESRVFQEYAWRCLDAAAKTPAAESGGDLTLDLSQCERLDSTFLGCLVNLHKHFNREGGVRFAVAAPPNVRRSLLAGCRLDRLLPIRDQAPEALGEESLLDDQEQVDAWDLGRHVMECHRRLAEQNCPGSEAFARVADQLEKELSEKR